jgi:hypothetical protein
MERAEAVIVGNCRVTAEEITARLGIGVARPWCKLLVEQATSRYNHSAHTDN